MDEPPPPTYFLRVLFWKESRLIMDGWNGWVYREVISTGGGLAKVHMKFSGKRDLALGGCSYYRLLYMVSYKLNYGGRI